jgi:hypothetical protein
MHVLVWGRTGEEAFGDAILHDLAQRRARTRLLPRQSVHLGISLVADKNFLIAVEHAQALRHVVEGGVEPDVLFLRLGLRLLQQAKCGVQGR